MHTTKRSPHRPRLLFLCQNAPWPPHGGQQLRSYNTLRLLAREFEIYGLYFYRARQLVIQAVLMACWQRPDREPVILHSDRGTQFTSYEYQRFLKDHHITLSMSDVGHCGDNAPAEGFFGMLKRERVNRRRYLTVADARSDVFDYIERFHNPRIQRRLNALQHRISTLTQPSAKTG